MDLLCFDQSQPQRKNEINKNNDDKSAFDEDLSAPLFSQALTMTARCWSHGRDNNNNNAFSTTQDPFTFQSSLSSGQKTHGLCAGRQIRKNIAHFLSYTRKRTINDSVVTDRLTDFGARRKFKVPLEIKLKGSIWRYLIHFFRRRSFSHLSVVSPPLIFSVANLIAFAVCQTQRYPVKLRPLDSMRYYSSSWIPLLLLCVTVSRAWIAPSVLKSQTTARSVRTTTITTCQWASSGREGELGFNELHTLLRDAVGEEDYMEAGRISDIVLERLHGNNLSPDERRAVRRRLSWKGLGAAPWLTERLDALNYTFPTTIQINALEAVNAILGDDSVDSSMQERIDKTVVDNKSMGVLISGSTGSGKSLAYSVPLLSTLSDSLFVRQRLRVGAEEQVSLSDSSGDGDLLDRLAVVTSPQLRTNSRRPVPNGSKTIAAGAVLASLGSSGKDVKSPLALIVVPSRELGVQTAMLLYQLIGGNIKDSPDEIVGRANMFQYKGPKGIRIGCVLDDDEASFGLKLQTDVAITMPQYLGKLIEDGDVKPSKLRVVVYDEADLALEETPAQDLQRLFQDDEDDREHTRLTMLVGATMTPSLGTLAVGSRLLPRGQSYIATATRFAPLDSASDAGTSFESNTESPMNSAASHMASLQDLDICMYKGLKHERAVVSSDKEVLLTLTRLLRRELQDSDQKALDAPNDAIIQRPRVVIFFPDEPRAKAAIEPLRDALWGEHRLCVLLPKTGVNPLTIMDQFKKNETSVMLATPNSVRGLDFPALTHVYTLYLPIEDPREYVHLAGRVGRIGQVGSVLGDGGHVISILPKDKADKMQALADALGFEFTDLDTDFSSLIPKGEDGSMDTENTDVETMRRYLEDQVTLLELSEEPDFSNTVVDVPSETVSDYDEKEDDYDDESNSFQ